MNLTIASLLVSQLNVDLTQHCPVFRSLIVRYSTIKRSPPILQKILFVDCPAQQNKQQCNLFWTAERHVLQKVVMTPNFEDLILNLDLSSKSVLFAFPSALSNGGMEKRVKDKCLLCSRACPRRRLCLHFCRRRRRMAKARSHAG